ncbi:MAG: hypothetical protein IAE94_14435 [Chthoniobacterales bacterium]|nr:hypothetical protein [Chthoniobacterales bacterium]
MSDNDFFGETWDEYQWERFLQEQDRNTEKYFRLLEKFVDHPERDKLIAREMGWDSCGDDAEIGEMADLLCGQEMECSGESSADDEQFDGFMKSPVYKETLHLHRWINNWIDSSDRAKDHPEAIRLATRSAACSAKLAAALCGDDLAELGMTIAYLKRALKASNDTLDAVAKLVEAGVLDKRRAAVARRHVFKIRNHIVDYMSGFRAEWRKRHGNT